MSPKEEEKAEVLLNAQIDFLIAELHGDRFESVMKEELTHLFSLTEKLTLNDAVTPEKIKKATEKYIINLAIPDAIPALLAEIAALIHAHEGHDDNTLGDIISDDDFKIWLDKIVAMDTVRERAIDEFVDNHVFTSMISDILYSAIKGFALDNNVLVKGIPGASVMMKLSKNVVNRAAPKLEKAAEETIKKYIHRNLKATLRQSKSFLTRALDSDEIADIAIKVWGSAKTKPISTFKKYIAEEDIEAFLGMGYKHWKGFRQTDYFSSLLEAGTDFFFEKYGSVPLTDLLTQMGVDKEMILEDAIRFAPDIIGNLEQSGYLRDFYRRRLEPFFLAESTKALL